MNKNYEQIKKVIENCKYKVLDDEGGLITIRYQLNPIIIYPSPGDDHFVSILLPVFVDVSEDNFEEVIMLCNHLNEQMKQVKIYTINNIIIAAAEFYYQGKKDLVFQIKNGLNGVISAKNSYDKQNKDY